MTRAIYVHYMSAVARPLFFQKINKFFVCDLIFVAHIKHLNHMLCLYLTYIPLYPL